jgi:hypothetical protein
MLCHECARRAEQTPAVGLCRFCLVGLCKDDFVAASRSAVVPQYGCDHHPERPFGDEGPRSRETGRRVRLPNVASRPAIGGRLGESPA